MTVRPSYPLRFAQEYSVLPARLESPGEPPGIYLPERDGKERHLAFSALRLFHGGKPGLGPGDLLEPSEPHFLDDCPICQAKKAGINSVFDPLTGSPDRLYITADREYARFYASKYWRGDLYVVEPLSEPEPSREDHFPTWKVTAARIRTVYQRCVEMTNTQRRALYRRWYEADKAFALATGRPFSDDHVWSLE